MTNHLQEENLFIRRKRNQKNETLLAKINGVMDEQHFGEKCDLNSFVLGARLYYRPSSDGGICLVEHVDSIIHVGRKNSMCIGQDYQRKPIYADVRLTARGMCSGEVARLYEAVKKLNVDWFQL